jgi:tRNA-modifying protein YgfZ
MSAAKMSLLDDRGVVAVTGQDAGTFLDGLITNDMGLLAKQGAIFAGLLSPQGKILFDFFVVKAVEGYLLDVALAKADELVKRLTMYKLRAKVDVSNRSRDYATSAVWGPIDAGDPAISSRANRTSFIDPRSDELGARILALQPHHGALVVEPADAYHAHRISLDVPEGGRDYVFGDTFPHEALFDQVNGVSFTKGCYVGQEIVARMEHRGTARKRLVRVSSSGALPPLGTDIVAGDVVIGAMGSSVGIHGLAMLRLDRAVEFAAKGVALTAAGVTLTPDADDVARLMPRTPDPVALG